MFELEFSEKVRNDIVSALKHIGEVLEAPKPPKIILKIASICGGLKFRVCHPRAHHCIWRIFGNRHLKMTGKIILKELKVH